MEQIQSRSEAGVYTTKRHSIDYPSIQEVGSLVGLTRL